MIANLVSGLRTFLRLAPEEWCSLLAQADLRPEEVESDGGLAPLYKGFAVFEAAAARSDRATLGIEYAQAFELGGTGPISFATLSAGNIEQALATLSRFIPIVTSTRSCSYAREGHAGVLSWEYGGERPRLQFAGFALALIMVRLAPALPPGWQPPAVVIGEHEPSDTAALAAFFGPGLRLERGPNRLAIEKELLGRPMPDADPRLHEIMTRLAEFDQQRRGAYGTDFVGQARGALSKLLQDGETSAADLAGMLGLTPARLRTQLKEHQTDFRMLIDDVRRDTARSYLLETDLLLTDIAFRLGYSDSSVFTRSCRKWFGEAPSEVRARARLDERGRVVGDRARER